MEDTQNRCRLMLIIEPQYQTAEMANEIANSGDVASVILLPEGESDPKFMERARTIIPSLQTRDIAVLIAYDTQTAGRSDADGIFMAGDRQSYPETIARFSPQKIAGCGNIKDRHAALVVGEMQPDFLFFGSPDGDIRPEPHKKNLALGEWWTQMTEIPCVVMGGSSLESVLEVAACGAEFVALGKAVFDNDMSPSSAIETANALLDEYAPILVDDA